METEILEDARYRGKLLRKSVIMSEPSGVASRPVDLPQSALPKLSKTLGRTALRRCPYCGGPNIYNNWFSLKDRCPGCNTLFAYEQGYFLGSYAVNLSLTAVLAVLIVFWMIFNLDLSIIQMQMAAVLIAVGMPLFLYPYSLSLWMCLDLLVHPPGDFSQRPNR